MLLGGAALTRKYVEWDLRNTFHGDVYYGQDAFDGLRIMNALSDGIELDVAPVPPVAKASFQASSGSPTVKTQPVRCTSTGNKHSQSALPG